MQFPINRLNIINLTWACFFSIATPTRSGSIYQKKIKDQSGQNLCLQVPGEAFLTTFGCGLTIVTPIGSSFGKQRLIKVPNMVKLLYNNSHNVILSFPQSIFFSYTLPRRTSIVEQIGNTERKRYWTSFLLSGVGLSQIEPLCTSSTLINLVINLATM